MNESVRRWLHSGGAIAAVIMLVTSLSALAVVRADNREPSLVAGGDGGEAGGETGGPVEASGSDGPSASEPGEGGASDSSKGGKASAGGGTRAAGSGGGNGGSGGSGAAAQPGGGGGQCADYNPNEGVYCDHFLVGGTTVLSGPLAIYGEQGLKGGQSWIQYARNELAPREGFRPAKLVYYDDAIDPNRTLQFVQRLVEVDKVLVIGGVTSPEAVADYLDKKQVPMIGDIGLSPRSYLNDMIFPTAPPYEVRADIRTKIAKEETGMESMAVIQEILPGVNPDPIKKGWEDAAEKHDIDLVFQTYDLSSTDNSCKGYMLQALQRQPEFIMMPIAAGTMLACMSEAANQGAKPGKAPYTFLKGWSGGSNLQFEVDQCGEQCYGMFSAGTPFLDPRTNPHPNAKKYLENMAKYAPGIDVTGFITINYYHAGLLQLEVMKQGGILNNLSRKNLIEAAKKFGPFETGFGNSVQWTDELPRVPTKCGYNVILDGKEKRWVFGKKKVCV